MFVHITSPNVRKTYRVSKPRSGTIHKASRKKDKKKTVRRQSDRRECKSALSLLKEMIELVLLLVLACSECAQDSSMDPDSFVEKKKRSAPRGYYGYPVLPYAEPLTILAGLAFIAYIIQAFHALYHQHHGLGGGILNNVLPGKSRNSFSEGSNQRETLVLKD